MLDTKGICKDEDILFRTPTYIEYVKTPSYTEEQLEHALKKSSYSNTSNTVNKGEQKPDMVNHPPHYTQGKIECIEVIKYINDKLHTEGYEGYCLGNFIKYIWRCNFKNGWEDIDKAIFYLDRLLTEQRKDD